MMMMMMVILLPAFSNFWSTAFVDHASDIHLHLDHTHDANTTNMITLNCCTNMITFNCCKQEQQRQDMQCSDCISYDRWPPKIHDIGEHTLEYGTYIYIYILYVHMNCNSNINIFLINIRCVHLGSLFWGKSQRWEWRECSDREKVEGAIWTKLSNWRCHVGWGIAGFLLPGPG